MRRTLILLAALLVPWSLSASGSGKPRYVPICRPLTVPGDEFSHCLPTTVTLKSESLNAGQRYLILGDRPPVSAGMPFHDLTLDVLLYYKIGEKLQSKTRDGEDQWLMNYAAAIFWCLYEVGDGNTGEASGKPSVCGAHHGIWPRQFQGRGPGGLSPSAVAQNILRGAMPALARSLPAPPPSGVWKGYTLDKVSDGPKPGKLCKAKVTPNRDMLRKTVYAELRGIPLPSLSDGKAALEICNGDDLVLRTEVPAGEVRCRIEPPYDVSDINTIAGNCSKKFGDWLRNSGTKL